MGISFFVLTLTAMRNVYSLTLHVNQTVLVGM